MGNVNPKCEWPNCECDIKNDEPCKYENPDFHIAKHIKRKRKQKVYLASSWDNPRIPAFKKALLGAGHSFYHFLDSGLELNYDDLAPDFKKLSAWDQSLFIDHHLVIQAKDVNVHAIEWCDVLVLIEPANKGSYTELGIAKGMGKHTLIVPGDIYTLGVMDAIADSIIANDDNLINYLRKI